MFFVTSYPFLRRNIEGECEVFLTDSIFKMLILSFDTYSERNTFSFSERLQVRERDKSIDRSCETVNGRNTRFYEVSLFFWEISYELEVP